MNNESTVNSRQPHICLYIGSLQKGGAERVMANLAEYLYGRGWEVTFVTTYFRPPEFMLPHGLWDPETGAPYENAEETSKEAPADLPDDAEVRWGSRVVMTEPAGIHRIYADPSAEELSHGRIRGFHARYRKLRNIWKEEKPDIILSFIGHNNIFSILTSRGLKIPVAVSVRSDPAREYASSKLRIPAFLLFRQAAGVIVQTHGAADFFPKGIRKKTTILPNAVNPDFLRPRYEGEREKRVVSVGRLDDNKNQGFLIEQFAIAHHVHPEYTLHLYGDGPSREKFENRAWELGVADAVVFEGVVSGVRAKIEKSMIFVLPSLVEGMPNALLEAMSAGLACIATDCPCGGPRDLIRDGENGFLVPVPGTDGGENSAGRYVMPGHARDSGSPTIAGRLVELMDNPALADRLGREAAKLQEQYGPDKVNAQWEAYLRGLVLHS